MDKFMEMAVLLDIYGELLTEKQKDVMDQYYNYDLSLQEIAENAGISKQGVHDLVKRAEGSLLHADEKLGFKNRLEKIQAGLENLKQQVEERSREKSQSPADMSALLTACREEIDNIINTCTGG